MDRGRGEGRGIDRRALLRGGLAAAGAVAAARWVRAAAPASAFELEEATVAGLEAAMERGEITSERLCEAYIARIEAVDGRLRSVLQVNPDALAEARRLDRERAEGKVRGPLHGIPVLVKDNIATADRMETTAGSLALLGARPPRDATVVARLRAAGAVILGKTNLSEWANFRSTHSSSGWSARGGQCRNPYALDRSPCGSSSGSAAAVSANLAALAVGTETDGSVVCPAATCGVVGIKPTLGRVSRAGIVPIAHSQDTAGPTCRTVEDAALLLAAVEGPDPADPATTGAGAHRLGDVRRLLNPGAPRGARIGVPRKRFWGYSPEADAVCEEALAALREAGAELVDPADIPHAGEYDDAELEVLLHEFTADIAAYLEAWAPGAPVRTLADLIAFNEAHRDEEMRYFGQELFEMALERGGLDAPEYRRALADCWRLAREEGLDAVFREHRLDALVMPTGAPAWTIDLINGDHYLGGSSTPAAVSGYPSITVPAGTTFGLPVGLSFVGPAWSEPRLLALAYAFERATRARAVPQLRPTAEL